MPVGVYKHKPQQGFQKGHKINKGKNNFMWKGGKFKDSDGYIIVLKPKHPFATKMGYICRSRFVMEKYLGRYLKRKEIVHHINKIRDDDRIKNFMLFKNRGFHIAFHKFGKCNPKGIIFDGRKTYKFKSVTVRQPPLE